MSPNSRKAVLAVSLEPNGVSASWVARDGVNRRARVCLCESDWIDAWSSGLREYDNALIEIKSRLGVPRGTKVVVAFESQTSVSEAQFIPEGDVQSALSSLRLAMCERLSISRRSESVCAKRVFAAKKGKVKSPGVAIVAASSERDVDCLREWIERAGLHCVGVVPTGALLLSEVARVSNMTLGSGLQAILHVDNYRCSLCIMVEGRAELLRTFEIGLNNLGEAIIRAVESSGERSHNLTNMASVLDHLHSHGIPKRDTEYVEEIGLSANSILPLLQPVLQRLCVEIKQSLRMVQRRASGSIAELQLCGPGASVPRLQEAIAQSIDAELAPDRGIQEDMSVEGCILRGVWRDLTLSSSQIQAAAGQNRFQRAVVCGAALGLFLLGGESIYYLRVASELESQIQGLDHKVQQVREFHTLSEAAVEMDNRLGEGQALLDEFLGSQPYWNAVLTGLAKSAQSRVELTEIRGVGEQDSASVLIYGVADATTGSTALVDFIDKLKSCDLGKSVEVESRLLIELDKNPVYQFRLRMSLIEFRPELLTMEHTP